MNRKFLLIAGGAALVVVLLALFLGSSRGTVTVRAERAVRQPIVNTIQTNGKIDPVANFEAHAPIPTTVRRVLRMEGDHVKQGELLLQLDDSAARVQAARALAELRGAEAALDAAKTGGTHAEVLSTEAQLVKTRTARDAAQRNLDAMRHLEQTGAASPAEVTAAEAQLKTAEAELNLAQQQLNSRYSRPEVRQVIAQKVEAEAAYDAAQDVLRHCNIISPENGTVYSLPVRQGQFVNTGDLLLQVADLSVVQVRAFVDEPDIGRLAIGEQVDVAWDALPGRTWQGSVTRVPTNVTVLGTRTVGEVACRVDNHDYKLIPNTNVNVTIMTARHDNALTVSREAMHQEDSRHFVYEIVRGVLHRREVETSISNLTRIEVTGGLTDGALVALGAINGNPLQPGMHVQVVER